MPSADVFAGLAGRRAAARHRDPARHLQLHRGDEQRRERRGRGRQLQPAQDPAADGIGAIAGSVLGSPFPPAVYIGHPGWKAVGGRIGYSLATGVVIALVCFLGLTALLLAVVPLVAILPILLYIGLVIGAQAFQASPKEHAPAVVLAIIPNVAAWGHLQVDSALNAAGTRGRDARRRQARGLRASSTTAWSCSAAAPCSPAWCSARSRRSSSTGSSRRRRCGLRRRGAGVLRLHPRRRARLGHVAARRARLRALRRRLLRSEPAGRATRTVSRPGPRRAGRATITTKVGVPTSKAITPWPASVGWIRARRNGAPRARTPKVTATAGYKRPDKSSRTPISPR